MLLGIRGLCFKARPDLGNESTIAGSFEAGILWFGPYRLARGYVAITQDISA